MYQVHPSWKRRVCDRLLLDSPGDLLRNGHLAGTLNIFWDFAPWALFASAPSVLFMVVFIGKQKDLVICTSVSFLYPEEHEGCVVVSGQFKFWWLLHEKVRLISIMGWMCASSHDSYVEALTWWNLEVGPLGGIRVMNVELAKWD